MCAALPLESLLLRLLFYSSVGFRVAYACAVLQSLRTRPATKETHRGNLILIALCVYLSFPISSYVRSLSIQPFFLPFYSHLLVVYTQLLLNCFMSDEIRFLFHPPVPLLFFYVCVCEVFLAGCFCLAFHGKGDVVFGFGFGFRK